jgi:3-methyladenine DNA glycosylase AlkD
MTSESPYLDQLHELANPFKAEEMATYHKAPRVYLGVANPVLNDLARTWRADLTPAKRAAVADALWASDIHEARVVAGKMLTQARIADDGPIWQVITGWAGQFDSWAIADHVCTAGQRRLLAHPDRLNEIEEWTFAENMWTRRAGLVVTLPWAKMANPKPADLEIRERVLGWAERLIDDRNWFMQKAIAGWVRDLSKHDAARAQQFMDENGDRLKSFARKEASRFLT